MGRKHEEAARKGVLAKGFAIPADTTDCRLALKRAIWTRGFTLKDLATKLGMNLDYIERVVSRHGNAAGKYHTLSPSLLNRIVEAVAINDYEARRLHMLAAIEVGWDVGLREIIPPARLRLGAPASEDNMELAA